MRQLYVCTQPFHCVKAISGSDPNELRPRLLGVLRELKPGISPTENGEYEFEYTIGGKFHEFWLQLRDLPDPNGVYHNAEIAHLLKMWLPMPFDKENSDMWQEYFDECLEMTGLTGLTCYDEWEWIKYFGKIGHHKPAYLYEVLPENIIRYD